MSRGAEVSLPFGGENRLFRMPHGRMRAVEEKCDAGPPELLARYVKQTWRTNDVLEPILQGLIGGGMAPHDAQRLFDLATDGVPLLQFVPIAQGIVMAFLIGAPDEEPGESPAGEATASRPFREERPATPPSTESGPSSD